MQCAAIGGIESVLHRALDVVFHDDRARLRTGNAPVNVAVVKHRALNLLKPAKPTISLITGERGRNGMQTTSQPLSSRRLERSLDSHEDSHPRILRVIR